MGATLLSAVQARRNVSVARADVAIFFVGAAGPPEQPLADICARYGVAFQAIASERIENAPVHFARHYLDRLLGSEITDVVHIDGDTQIAGSLEPLLDIPLARGRVLAARDPMAVMINHPNSLWRARRDYLLSIGLPAGRLDRYFNSGVFRIHRSDADAMGRECLRLCRKLGSALRFSEQDAFNLAFGDATDLMSFKWNFPVFFLNGGFEATIAPHIVHYMSNPRPWQGAFRPWGRPAYDTYRELARTHPELADVLRPLRGWRALRYRAQQRTKQVIESRTWTRTPVRDRVAQFERDAVA